MPTIPYKQHVAEVEFGLYAASLKSVDEVANKTPKKEGQEWDALSFRWVFVIDDPRYSGVELSKFTSRIYSKKSHCYAFARALGHLPAPAAFNSDSIIGARCKLKVDVSEVADDGSQYSNIVGVLSMNKAQSELDLFFDDDQVETTAPPQPVAPVAAVPAAAPSTTPATPPRPVGALK